MQKIGVRSCNITLNRLFHSFNRALGNSSSYQLEWPCTSPVKDSHLGCPRLNC